MIEITPDITIPDDELDERFIQASGPGGQNVNKVATAVQLRFQAARSRALPPGGAGTPAACGRIQADHRRRAGHHGTPLSHPGGQPARRAGATGRAHRAGDSGAPEEAPYPSDARRP